ncbi:hypothetical protein JCM10550A_12910 [Methanogenium cariaci]
MAVKKRNSCIPYEGRYSRVPCREGGKERSNRQINSDILTIPAAKYGKTELGSGVPDFTQLMTDKRVFNPKLKY